MYQSISNLLTKLSEKDKNKFKKELHELRTELIKQRDEIETIIHLLAVIQIYSKSDPDEDPPEREPMPF